MIGMPSLPLSAADAGASVASPVWDAEPGSSVLQNDTAWLLSFIDILTLLLTLFVLLLAYDHNAQPVGELSLVAPQERTAERPAPQVAMRESRETRYPEAMPLLITDWFTLLDPRSMTRADSIETLALADDNEPDIPVTDTAALESSHSEPLSRAASTAALSPPEADLAPERIPATDVAPLPKHSPLPDTETPVMSLAPDATDAARAAVPTLLPPGAQAVLELLPNADGSPQETAAAAVLLQNVSAALRERIEVSVATGVVNLEISDNILFQPGSATLTEAGYAVLDELAVALRDQSSVLSVEGHTDNVPIQTALFPSNWELSSARAAMVTRSLITRGIAPDRIRAIGYGETRPRADNVSAEGRARNRRVSFVLQLE